MNAIYARQSVDRADSISIESQIEFCQYEMRGEQYASARACAWPRRRWTRRISTSSTRPSINKRKNAPAFVSEGRGIFR